MLTDSICDILLISLYTKLLNFLRIALLLLSDVLQHAHHSFVFRGGLIQLHTFTLLTFLFIVHFLAILIGVLLQLFAQKEKVLFELLNLFVDIRIAVLDVAFIIFLHGPPLPMVEPLFVL